MPVLFMLVSFDIILQYTRVSKLAPKNVSFLLSMNFERVLKVLDYYEKFIPYNYEGEKMEFFRQIEKGIDYNPLFMYKDKLKASDYLRLNRIINKEKGDNKLVDEYLKVYEKISELMIAWKNDEYDLVTIISGELFGDFSELSEQAIFGIYDTAAKTNSFKKNTYDADQITLLFNKELKKNKLNNWQTECGEIKGVEFNLNGLEKKIIVKDGCSVQKEYWLRAETNERSECHCWK